MDDTRGHPGERKAVDLTDIDEHPPQNLSDEPVMDLEAYKTTILVRVRRLEEDADAAEAAARAKELELALAADGTSPGRGYGMLDDMASRGGYMLSSAVGTARTLVTSMYGGSGTAPHTPIMAADEGMASLASKYSVKDMSAPPTARVASRAPTRAASVVGGDEAGAAAAIVTARTADIVGEGGASPASARRGEAGDDTEDALEAEKKAAIELRERALDSVLGQVYGVAEVRKFWERGFCYVVFNTLREAQFALHKIQSIVKAKDSLARGLITNCFYL